MITYILSTELNLYWLPWPKMSFGTSGIFSMPGPHQSSKYNSNVFHFFLRNSRHVRVHGANSFFDIVSSVSEIPQYQ